MYPNLTLKIENHIPHIFFHLNENTVKEITSKNENLRDEILNLAKLLGFLAEELESEEQLNKILELVSESDSTIELSVPDINTNDMEFNLKETLKKSLDEVLSLKDEYENIEMSEKVRVELNKNKKLDILGSLMDLMYDIIIAKTLLAAYDLEINEIHLENKHNYARFNERMGNELQKLGLEFTLN